MKTLPSAVAVSLLLCASAARAQVYAAGADRDTTESGHPEAGRPLNSTEQKAAAKPEQAPAVKADNPSTPPEKTEPAPVTGQPAAAAKKDEAAPAKDEKPAEKEQAKPEAIVSKPIEKPLNADAAKFAPVADAYQKAHDQFLVWLRGASETMTSSEAKIEGLKKQIEDSANEATKLDLEQTPEASQKAKEARAHKDELWKQLKDEQARHRELLRALGKAVNEKVRDYNQTVWDAAKGALQPAR